MSKPTLPGALLLLHLFFAFPILHAQPVRLPETSGKIQLAILLDVSNSMDGLIRQAKSQLWNTVITIGKFRCDEKPVDFEIAIYEYGRSGNNEALGYVRLISPFSRDLDLIYKRLNDLNTDGGEEYCGVVMKTSLSELGWDSASSTYKTIFIAGNESFEQGPVNPKQACELAIKKGVIVNTIYCGRKENGITEHWNLENNCGKGGFSWINQDAKEFSVPTPFDDELVHLKLKFNETYIPYGRGGISQLEQMRSFDTVPFTTVDDPNIIEKYIVVKTDPSLYNNAHWDLVDAMDRDSTVLGKIDRKTLLPFLQEKTIAELKKYVEQKTMERNAIRKTIRETEQKKGVFIENAKKKAGLIKQENTLENQIQRIITEQASRFKIKAGG